MPTSRTGRLLAAACLFTVGLTAVVSRALSPATGDPGRAAVDTYAAHLGRVDGALSLNVFVVLLGAAVALAALLARPGSPKLAAVAGWTGVISSGAWIAMIGADLAVRAAVDTDREASDALLTNLIELPQFQAFVFVSLLGGLVAMICLGAALWRAHVVPIWAAAALVAYEPVNILTGDAGAGPRAVAGVFLLVGLGACAVTILRGGLPGLSHPTGRPAGDRRPAQTTGPATAPSR